MSDARTTPPSFDEMVGLIKKMYSDYLEDVLKSKPEEIEKSWERYKTLNHLWRDEAQLGTWVKASDRLPGYETPVKWRDGNDHSHVTNGKIPLIHMAKPFLTGWEWYDEGTAAGREEDGNEFVKILDNALAAGNQVLEQLKKENAAQEDAVAFAEWVYKNRWFRFENGRWEYTFEQGSSVSRGEYLKNYIKTTAQLYELFKQQKH